MSESYVAQVYESIVKAVDGPRIIGNRSLVDLVIMSSFAGGHVLIEGPPGTGKTMTARLFAQILGRSFKRIQFTSDLLPADIIGGYVYSQKTEEFSFVEGPIFANVVLADEINRSPPRTQSAMLEAMEERQVTVEGKLFPMAEDFLVMATQNPMEYEGTFPLPEAQIDRFLVKIVLRYGDLESDVKVLRQGLSEGALEEGLAKVELDRHKLEAELNETVVSDAILQYVGQLMQATRNHPMMESGSSVRGGLALARLARVMARIKGREFVVADDIKALALPVLRHRVKLSTEAQISRISDQGVIEEILNKVPFPT